MYAMLLQAAGESGGIGWGDVLSGIPHDAPAIFIYLLTAAVVGWVVWASRKRPKDPGAPA